MIFSTSIKMAFQNLRANKMRSFLTMLGIIIGISSMIIIMSVGAGAESLIVNQIRGIGSNLIGVLPGASESDGPPASALGIVITTLTDDDTQAVAKLPHVVAASSYVSLTEALVWQNNKVGASIQGSSYSYPIVSESTVQEGSFFTAEDERALANVVVLGSTLKTELFGNQPALGESIRIRKQNFIVIGVMEPRGTTGFQNVDRMAFVPVTTAQKKLLGINYIGFMRAKIDDEKNLAETEIAMTELLRDRHNITRAEADDFSVRNMAQALDILGTISAALTLFLAAIAGISLIVGGIGIMNIMLAAVLERIQEIGLRKAVGARNKHITWQFLTETITISLIGAILGIAIGTAISFAVSQVMTYLEYDWDFVIPLSSIVISTSAATIIGIIFGYYPARRAARQDPISALRYE